ncbi:hypothetical protein SAY86_011608 [Trapa natans]|uniref:Bifunctional inhibitor/plant lipid transfer protein/seed storage helical domain-containing protein n=1 Tax=Trapa natans TaxID=22666 RepID=A0AAN7R4E2_TRANT|nr:hypothetical protein SAY86_011608 [Trapa natans]
MGDHARARTASLVLATYAAMILCCVTGGASGADDASKDRDECTDQLVGMATCLPYVQGEARAPTPDCCTGLKQVLATSKKCLCVIVKDGNDPQLGLNINVTLALGLPSICQASVNVSHCPALLHLDPNSPEAKVFYQYAAAASSPSPSASVIEGPVGAPAAVAGGNAAASAPQHSSGLGMMKTSLTSSVAAAGFALMWLPWPALMKRKN